MSRPAFGDPAAPGRDRLATLYGQRDDIYGWPVGGASEECAKLSEDQRELVSDGVRQGRLVPARLGERYEFVHLIRSIEDMALRGLVQRTSRGCVLTGRGMALRETLLLGISGG